METRSKLSAVFLVLLIAVNINSQSNSNYAEITGRIIFEKDSIRPLQPYSLIFQKEWPVTYKKYEQIEVDSTNYHFKERIELNQITCGSIIVNFFENLDSSAMEKKRHWYPDDKIPEGFYKSKYAIRTRFMNLKFILEPGDNLNVLIDFNNPDKFNRASVLFTGAGGTNNNYLRATDKYEFYKESFKMPLEKGLKHEDQLLMAKLDELNEARDSISTAYYNLLKLDARFENLKMKHVLIRASLYGTDIGVGEKRSLARKYYSFMDSLVLSPEYLNSPEFRGFQDFYLEYLNRIITGKDVPFGFSERNYWLAKAVFDDTILKAFLYERLISQLEIPFDYHRTAEQYKDFILRFPETPESNRLIKIYKKHFPVTNGQLVPNLELVDSIGRENDLSNLRGKVIIISSGQSLMNMISHQQKIERIELLKRKFGDDLIIVALDFGYRKESSLSKYVDYYVAEGTDSEKLYSFIFLSAMRYNFIVGKDGIINECVGDLYISEKKISTLISQKYTVITRIKNFTENNKNEIIIALSVLVILILLILIFSKVRQRKQILIRRHLNSELKALRSQLNPHFLFNSLNSIQNFINKSDSKSANMHLSKFSQLMRRIIELSETASITLNEELEFNKTYIELEQLRYGFNYSMEIDDSIDQYNTEIPSMIIQPFIENAIVHCMSDLGEKGELRIFVRAVNENKISIEINDNGKGFELDSDKGFGLTSSRERIDLLNSQNREKIELHIENRKGNQDSVGTKVSLTIPKKY